LTWGDCDGVLLCIQGADGDAGKPGSAGLPGEPGDDVSVLLLLVFVKYIHFNFDGCVVLNSCSVVN
jgi:hypothetical protein